MDGGGVLKRRSLGLKPELKKPILRRKTGEILLYERKRKAILGKITNVGLSYIRINKQNKKRKLNWKKKNMIFDQKVHKDSSNPGINTCCRKNIKNFEKERGGSWRKSPIFWVDKKTGGWVLWSGEGSRPAFKASKVQEERFHSLYKVIRKEIKRRRAEN